MGEALLDIGDYQLLIFDVIPISLHLSLHVLNEVAEFCEHERDPEIFH